MINLFEISSKDLSVYYLQRIFGNMGGLFPSGDVTTILGSMFKTFNSIVLSIGALIVVYIIVFGVMASAQEGEFLGKKWHKLWVPIRTVGGIAALVPAPSGYSFLQIAMMWVILQGVGAADTMWTTVLRYKQSYGTIYTSNPFTGEAGGGGAVDLETKTQIKKLFQGLACSETLKSDKNDPTFPSAPGETAKLQNGFYYCNANNPNKDNGFCTQTPWPPEFPGTPDVVEAGVQYKLNGKGAQNCGSIQFCNEKASCTDPTSLQCKTCRGQIQGLATIIPVLRTMARTLLQADYDYQEYYVKSQPQIKMLGLIPIPVEPPPFPIKPWINQFCLDKSGHPCTYKVTNSYNPRPMDAGKTDSAQQSVVEQLYLPYALSLKDVDVVGSIVTQYQSSIVSAINDYNRSNPTPLSGVEATAQKQGWILAGAYYYYLANAQGAQAQSASPKLIVSLPPSYNEIGFAGGENAHPRTNYQAAEWLMSGAGSAAAMDDPSAKSAEIMSSAVDSVGSILADCIKSKGNANNPLLALTNAGHLLLDLVPVLWVLTMVLLVAEGIVGGINLFVIGSGALSPVFKLFDMINSIIIPAFLFFVVIIMAVGASLAVYIPLIPYMIFAIGAVGWITSCVEAMVAGPLVALGILSPGGQHEILGKAEPALLLLFNIFLRPTLMIFGLIIALLLASVAVSMVNAAFGIVMHGIISEGGSRTVFNPFESVIFMVAYMMLIISVLNKCFAAIHLIPENVMRWIGGKGEQYGEAETLSSVKGGVDSAAKTSGEAAGAGQKGLQSMNKGIQDSAEKKKKAEAKAKANKNK